MHFLTSGNSIRLRRNFDRSRIFAGFGKNAGFWPEPEPKPDSGATLIIGISFCPVIYFTKLLHEVRLYSALLEVSSKALTYGTYLRIMRVFYFRR